MISRFAALLALAMTGAAAAEAQTVETGVYLCTVDQRAGVGGIHIEGAGPPEAFIDEKPRVRFRIQIARGPGFTISELAYDGPDHDEHAWQTENAVLHSHYRGDGRDFLAVEDLGFLRIGNAIEAGKIWFLHGAFEYPGGEDTNVTARSGTCVREKPKS